MSSNAPSEIKAPLLPTTSTSPPTPTAPLEKGKATAFATGTNLLNELEGAGLLGLPYAISLAGWGAIGCLIFVGIMAGFTGYCLAMCMYDENHKRVRQTYKSIGLEVFGKAGERMVVAVQMANLTSVGIVSNIRRLI